MFSDSIHECISTLIEEYLNYDDYSFYYKEQLINALSHLYSILYKLDIPPGLEEDLHIGIFKIWAKKLPRSKQNQIVNTMYNRAKFHANQTKDMKKAMKVFQKWMK